MGKILLICQGSQSIQLIRELFSIGYTPDLLYVITVKNVSNNSFIEFIKYYEINNKIIEKNSINDIIISTIQNFQPSITVSFSNSFILDSTVLKMGTKFINFHPGILPDYKGSLSTVYSLINKEKYVGGTWHYLSKKVDGGNIIKIKLIPISNLDTAFSLNHKIFSSCIPIIKEVIDSINSKDPGTKNEGGKFYYNNFPMIDYLPLDMQRKIKYFPPKFK